MPSALSPARQVLLIANYPRDGQESMLRFARMLAAGLRARGVDVRETAPPTVLGRWLPTWSGLGKWLAYFDKYVLFPWLLRWRLRGLGEDACVHICDHSNAVYVPVAASSGRRVVVTCHDLGAVRGALGEDTDCPASATGRILQQWIAHSLAQAAAIASVSEATGRDVARLIRRPDGTSPEQRVVLLGLNTPYRALSEAESADRLRPIPGFDLERPFVLNVGSSLRRKNREGVLRIFAQTRAGWPAARLVFAGEALPPETVALVRALGLDDCVQQVVAPADAVLEALYSRAFALLFPSRFEGFGWPAIEAQACGCPVLSSDAGALEEVVAQSGFVRDAGAEADFAGELLRLAGDAAARGEWIRLGLANVARFNVETMIDGYLEVYGNPVPDQRETVAAFAR